MSEFGKMLDEKCMSFAVRIVNLCRFLDKESKEKRITDQLLRSGTSIGANYAEAEFAISDNDFISKLFISLKECNETSFWLRLLRKINNLNQAQFESIYEDCTELQKLFVTIIKTKRKNMEII
ncbi:MAG: four helix bundle protein [Prevotella sp.]|nr:four helix bundle protein [Prevotella sp.]